MPAVLVVGDVTDHGVRAAAALAAARGASVTWLSGAALAEEAEWLHTVTPDGRGHTSLGEGARIWYRSAADAGARRWADPRDAVYATAEYSALLVSWLAAGDSVNAVDGASPWGPSWSVARWLAAAAQAGLPVAPRGGVSSARLGTVATATPVRSVLVAGGRVAPSYRYEDGCRRLAEAARCAILQLDLDQGDRVTAVHPRASVDTPEKVTAVAAFLVDEAS